MRDRFFLFRTFLVLLFAISSPNASTEPLDAEGYASIRNAALTVSDGNRFVLGIGRSPVPLVDFLNRRNPNSATSLPITGFRYHPDGAHRLVPAGDEDTYRPLTAAEEKKLFEHFDRYFPSDAVLAGREVSLVDYSQKGDTALGIEAYLRRYLAARGRKVTLHLTLLTGEDQLTRLARRAIERRLVMTAIPLPRTSYLHALEHDNNTHWAPFGAYRLRDLMEGRLPPPASNAEFTASLAEHITQDSLLPRSQESLAELHLPQLIFDGENPTRWQMTKQWACRIGLSLLGPRWFPQM